MVEVAIAAIALLTGGAVVGGIWFWSAKDARALAKRVGKLEGENDALKATIVEKDRELEAFRVALSRALDPPPTLDDLDRVSREAAGEAAPADAASAIDVS